MIHFVICKTIEQRLMQPSFGPSLLIVTDCFILPILGGKVKSNTEKGLSCALGEPRGLTPKKEAVTRL